MAKRMTPKERFGVSIMTISRIARDESWKEEVT